MASTPNRFTFTGSQGGELSGRLDLPPTEPRAFALFAHCFTCGKDIAAASRISAGLVAEGYAVLRFDFTGLGSSEGEFANTSFTSNVEDLVAAADALRDRHEAPSLLVGHSLGGAAVLAAAPRIEEVTAVATIAAPSEPAHVAGVFDDADIERIRRDGEAEVRLAGRPFTVGAGFLDDIDRSKLTESLATMRAALMIMHSPVDNLVGVDHARAIHEAARHPKSFVSLDGADHLLTDRADAAWAADVLAAWAGRYVPELPEHDHAEGEVLVEEAETGDFTQTVHAGNHHLLADEPKGTGDDRGPTPYDLLLAGLGACTSMTIRMYARRKELPLDDVRVTLRHERTHADDCRDESDRPCRVEVIDRDIELVGDLTDDQRAKLLEIAGKCPVHRTLESDLRVHTRLVDA
ncbi:MAG: alpha/beta fold hydrolase [Acidimicrobiales bacterium]|nr:alpha/beta fold hydrolase [Acidimicrobiales bacterium]